MSNQEMLERLQQMRAELDDKSKPVESKAPEPEKSVPVEDQADAVDKFIAEEPVQEMSESESKARSQGWRPKEEFSGNPKDWVDAETYIERGPTFRHIQGLKEQVEAERKENKKHREVVAALVEDIRNAEAKAREQVLKELDAQKQKAIAENDLNKYVAVEDEYKKFEPVKKEELPEKQQQQVQSTSAWKRLEAACPWVNNTKTDTKAAEQYFDMESAVQKHLNFVNPNASVDEQIDVAIKFAQDHYNVKPEVKPKVAGSAPGVGGSSKPKEDKGGLSPKDLTPNQRKIYEALEDGSYGMSPKDYLESLSKRKS